MEYQLFSLPNGIRVLYKKEVSKISHCCLLINSGSRDETEGKSGLAHFIEHLLFKGTTKRNTNQILNRLEVVGGDLNAYTTKEYTCLQASFLTPHLDRATDLLADIAFNSSFPEDEMVKEKSVILDEITSYLDQPEEAIADDFEALLFKGHQLGENILGNEESVKGFEKTDINAFINKNYNTHQIIFAISGNYPDKKIQKLATQYFNHLKENNSIKNRQNPLFNPAEKIAISKPINQAHAILGAQAYGIHHPQKTALLLLNNLLGGYGMSSRLNLEVREKHGIAYTIESGYVPLSDTGIFTIYFGTDEEKVTRAEKIIYRELKKLRENRLGVVQLHQTKQKFIGQIGLGEENRMSVLISMAKSMLDYGKIDTIEEIFAKINAITAEQILTTANEIFDVNQLSSLTFLPSD